MLFTISMAFSKNPSSVKALSRPTVLGCTAALMGKF